MILESERFHSFRNWFQEWPMRFQACCGPPVYVHTLRNRPWSLRYSNWCDCYYKCIVFSGKSVLCGIQISAVD